MGFTQVLPWREAFKPSKSVIPVLVTGKLESRRMDGWMDGWTNGQKLWISWLLTADGIFLLICCPTGAWPDTCYAAQQL